MELPQSALHDAVGEISEVPASTPLLAPAAGLPALIDTQEALRNAITELSRGKGPFALDAERASGYKYSSRAYLIQIKRENGGLHLIDPIPFGPDHPLFAELNQLLQGEEVILHASTQDLPCLRELGINPSLLFDTELGARIAGLPRVGLGPLIETLMGITLAKEHSAVDWSQRPLPSEWLNYAALDVELLIELRNKIYQLLEETEKLQWALEDFAAILSAPPPPPRIDPWRRTSGMHKVKRRNHLAVIRELWQERNSLAQELDISPGRLLSDAAITELALASDKGPITNRMHLEKILKPLGLRPRWLDNAATWISCITRAIAMPEELWPEPRTKSDAMPPIKIWKERFPDRYAPLTHARFNLQTRAEELSIPLENLISPELVRKICWEPPVSSVQEALIAMGARRWQSEIAAPILQQALLETVPLELPTTNEAEITDEKNI
jgi:ribonuclease D